MSYLLLTELNNIKYHSLEKTGKYLKDKKNMTLPDLNRLVKNTVIDIEDEEEYKKYLKLVNILYRKIYKNHMTLKKKFSNIRTTISKKYGKYDDNKNILPRYQLSLNLIHIPKSANKELISNYKTNLKIRNETRKVYNKDDILNTIMDNYDSNDIYNVAVALLLASGLRPIELFDRVEVEQIEGKSSYVKFCNLAKKRGDLVCNIRPLIHLNSKVFIKLLKKVRNSLKIKIIRDSGELNKSIANSLSRRVKRIFNKEFQVRTLRPIYGNMAYEIYADKQKTNLNVYLQEILGHSDENMTSSFAYSAVFITDNKPNQEVKRGMNNVMSTRALKKDVKEEIVKKTVNELVSKDIKPGVMLVSKLCGINIDIVKKVLENLE